MDTGSYAFGHNVTFANHFVVMRSVRRRRSGRVRPIPLLHRRQLRHDDSSGGTGGLHQSERAAFDHPGLLAHLGWQFTPFTVVQGGGQGTQSAAFSPETQLLTGFGSDASSMLGFNDFLCANLNPVGGFPGCGVDNRFTDPRPGMTHGTGCG